MPPRSNVPIRICGSKTRTGCKTCKQRHVKCDEARPVCSRCQKAHRQCIYEQPGEQNTLATGQNAQVGIGMARRSRSPRVSPDLDIILGSYGPREVLEVSAIKNFAVHVGKELAGCFSTDVWCRILPRVAQHEPSIWHALVAVSTLDTHLRLGSDRLGGDSDANTAIRHYSAAIRELSLRLGSGTSAYCKDVVLLTCLLFAIFECLQGHYGSAIRHITGGTKLLMEWDQEAQSGKRASPGGYFDHTSLQPMFLALDSQAVQMGANNFQDYFSLPAIGSNLQVPMLFPTVEAAHLSLNHIFNRLSRWSYWVEPDPDIESKPDDAWIVAEGQRLGVQLTQWDLAFQTLLDITNHHQQPAIFLLLTQRKVLQAYYHKSIDGWSEMEWDKSLPLWREAVEHAETYMQFTTITANHNQFHKPTQPGRSRPIFTVAMDIVLSLYLICVKCRDSVLRRRALSMLQICDRKEGIWDSRICAVMAAKIIAFEEKGAMEDGFIPESARIFRLSVHFHEEDEEQEEGTGLDITHQKLISVEDGSQRIEKFEEDIAW